MPERSRTNSEPSPTYAFSKMRDIINAALGLYCAFYNSCRLHKSINLTPARVSGLTDQIWMMADLLN
jgi:hypothetical protein